MLESGLFFALGFLCAVLLALMVAPAIWRRAVVLTRKRIEETVPLSLDEIQADKDQLRAKFAMNTRGIEVVNEKLKSQSAEQTVELNRQREQIAAMQERHESQVAQISELESQVTEVSTVSTTSQVELEKTNSILKSVEAKLAEKTQAFEDLDLKYKEAVDDFDGQKIEIVARETRLDTIQDEAREAKEAVKRTAAEKDKIGKETKALNTVLEKEQRRNEKLENKLSSLQATLADMEGRLERRDSDLAKFRSTSGKAGDNVEKAMQAFENERNDLELALKRSEAEKEALKQELTELGKGDKDAEQIQREENAKMRDKISEFAAQLTASTALEEGKNSPINKAVSKAKPKKTSGSKKSSSARKTDDTGTLAGRIKALQASAEKA